MMGEAKRARPFLVDFLENLPADPAVILVMGKSVAWPAWHAAIGGRLPRRLRDTEIVFIPHPGPLSINQPGKGHREEIRRQFAHAAEVCRSRR
ncbi:hypothetical protein ACTWPB_22705 [Nocardia sp. IBHARD005]|uniref:hypothetical protein n=1 Tax=Nocardia sp. IBHARD005 TaxID=3457765 RepID=UPI004058A117